MPVFEPLVASVERADLFVSSQHHDAKRQLVCGELFAGCGGMSLGLAQAGFEHRWMVEFNSTACLTLRQNAHVVAPLGPNTLLEVDVRKVDWNGMDTVDLLAGGPPCQPFSSGGRALGREDSRDMWPEAVKAVAKLRPRGFLFESVKGLLRPAFSEYVAHVVRQLKSGGGIALGGQELYDVAVISVNAADYGSPQRRERVFVAGVRKDCGSLAPFPTPTHSIDRLVWEKWISDDYWRRHNLPRPQVGPTSSAEQRVLQRLMRIEEVPSTLPWLTCRDAFCGLGAPVEGASASRHELRRGAKAYPGHEGSPIDEPAKALKAGTHGVPGGENMLVESDGTVRYFTVREAARLQGMPDKFDPAGPWSQVMKQLGNAVPVQLAKVAGHWLTSSLNG